ncbi:PREDICTED: transient receptor potential channel pyrexia-like, partial [Dinoponera quadriceps]|uniref:Transient receptor potential channel pyrexia-like n=1 Tax=Dinoponera quadriceps TaxID=609295 RepID=A0A6P3Y7A5_DINQU
MSRAPQRRQTAPDLLIPIPMDTFLSEENDRIQIEDDDVCECPSPRQNHSKYIGDYVNPAGIDRSSVHNNKHFIRIALMKHARQEGCRFQLCKDLEKLSGTDETNTFLAACEPNEINVLLLYASFLGRADLICRLCEHDANVNHAESDVGLTALHLCAFRNCLYGVRYLIEKKDANIRFNQTHTPFHYAAFGNSYDVARYFLELPVTQEASSQDEETVLHVAARADAVRVLSLLALNNNEMDRFDRNGFAAIHYAALYGNLECLNVFLQSDCPVNLPTESKKTALHMAATGGWVDVVRLLIESNADIQQQDQAGDTALHAAVNFHRLECVEALLVHDADPNAENNIGRSSLHQALNGSPISDNIIELLLTANADVKKADRYGNTPLHIAASKELSRYVNLLIEREADLSAKTKEGTSALSIVLRKTPTCLDIFKQRLDKFVTLQGQGFVAGELKLKMEFRPLLPPEHCGQSDISYLNMFVKEGYKEILQHPLCQSFLHLKWKNIRKFYIARLFSYLVYLLFLMSWVMTGLAYNCYNESHGIERKPPLCTDASGIFVISKNRAILEEQWVMLVVLTLLEIVRKITVLPSYLTVRQFFTQENLVDWCLILTVLAISCVYTDRTYAWQRYLGAFAVFCGWSNLMLMIGQFPMFGTYVAMFTSVQAEVFKLLLAYACLLVGFTASFCIIFPHDELFSSFSMAFIKILAMMTGELTFDYFFQSNKTFSQADLPDVNRNTWVFQQISAQFFFMLFLLIVTIVLMNLLIGIAVHDIKGLQKSAGLEKLVRQTNLIYDMEVALHTAVLPKRLLKWLRWSALIQPSPVCPDITVHPLNPRETSLPRDILSAAYSIAKEGNEYNNSPLSRRNTYGSRDCAKTFLKDDVSTASRRRCSFDENTLTQNYNILKNDFVELKMICKKILTLLQEPRRTHST